MKKSLLFLLTGLFCLSSCEKTNDVNSPDARPSNGTENGYEWVNLGLSVMWATCNVGASSPEGYGNYYAWGETTTKSTYTWSTYKYCEGTGSNAYWTKYCVDRNIGTVDYKTILEPNDDVAHVKWGGNWRMPTRKEQNELYTKCSWTWTTQGGTKGYKITGKNGNSIFLPASGCRNNSSLSYVGSHGNYWSSSLDTGYRDSAYDISFQSTDITNSAARVLLSSGGRIVGYSVRPVCPYEDPIEQ